MRDALEFFIFFAYFILVAATVKRSKRLHITGYLILAIAHLMMVLLKFLLR